MTTIKIVQAKYNKNVGQANSSIQQLQAQSLTATNISGTNLKPFVQAIKLEKELEQVIKRYESIAEHDTVEYSKVSNELAAADTKVANSFQ